MALTGAELAAGDVDFGNGLLLWSAHKAGARAEHLAKVMEAADNYFAAEPFTLGYRYDESVPEHVVFLDDLKPPPQGIALETGECVQALRTALDYVVASLIECSTGNRPDSESRFEFPIFLDRKAYEKTKVAKLAGVDPEDVKVIDSSQPFTVAEPTKHPLWLLHRLNIADKHRQLHVVAGGLWTGKIQHIGAGGANAFSISDNWVADPLRFPLTIGSELLRYRSESPVPGEVNIEFQPALLFDEPPETHKWLVLPLLVSLADNTTRVVEGLASAWLDDEGV